MVNDDVDVKDIDQDNLVFVWNLPWLHTAAHTTVEREWNASTELPHFPVENHRKSSPSLAQTSAVNTTAHSMTFDLVLEAIALREFCMK